MLKLDMQTIHHEGVQQQREPDVQVVFRMPKSLRRKVRELAVKNDVPIRSVVIAALHRYLEHELGA